MPAQGPGPEHIAQTISHYEVLGKIGEGGMGAVYKARDTRLDRIVALKFLAGTRALDADRRLRFLREAKSASALNHPNIAVVYDVEQTEAGSFIAMEYVDGEPLSHAIPRGGMRLGEALRLATQTADALAAAHRAGIVHRDVKPGNIMLSRSGSIKVVDFGLAKLVATTSSDENAPTRTLAQTSEDLTSEGQVVGTTAYMSPEQADGGQVDARSDIFSFGCVLYEMLSGRRAFEGTSNMRTVAAILSSEPQPISRVRRGIPA
jgi:serine/threonine protein kinase